MKCTQGAEGGAEDQLTKPVTVLFDCESHNRLIHTDSGQPGPASAGRGRPADGSAHQPGEIEPDSV